MKNNFLAYLHSGLFYQTEDQARRIALALLTATAITDVEFTEMDIAIRQHFNPPTPEVLPEEPLQ